MVKSMRRKLRILCHFNLISNRSQFILKQLMDLLQLFFWRTLFNILFSDHCSHYIKLVNR